MAAFVGVPLHDMITRQSLQTWWVCKYVYYKCSTWVHTYVSNDAQQLGRAYEYIHVHKTNPCLVHCLVRVDGMLLTSACAPTAYWFVFASPFPAVAK